MIHSLIDDILNYDPIEIKFVSEKAAKVFFNCMKNKKFKLARKIQMQYCKKPRYDAVTAFEYCMTALQKIKT